MSSPNKTTAQLVSDLATAVVQSKDYTDKQPRAIGFDEIIPKKARLDVTMTPSLERSKVAGSPHGAQYWAERLYQACRSGLYRNPKEAYAGIIRQAEKTGLSENQRGELLRFLGAAGIDVGDKEQDNLNEPYKMTASEKREAAQEDVTARVLASVKNHLGQEHALTHLGKMIAESKRAASFTQRKAVRVNNDRNINDIRGYAKAASVAEGDVESVFRVASAMLSGARLASEPSPRIKKAAGLVVRCMSAGRNLLKQGFSHQEVAKHIAQMPVNPAVQQVDSKTPVQPGMKKTVMKTDKGTDALVVEPTTAPPIKTASRAHPESDAERIAIATRRLVSGQAEGDNYVPEENAEPSPMSREALVSALDQIHQSGEVTLGAREVVASQIESGDVTDYEQMRAELARKMSE